MMGDDFPGEVLTTKGNQPPYFNIPPGHSGLSIIDRAITLNPAINISPPQPLPDLESALLPFFSTTDFSHPIRGKERGGTQQHFIKTSGTQLVITSPIN